MCLFLCVNVLMSGFVVQFNRCSSPGDRQSIHSRRRSQWREHSHHSHHRVSVHSFCCRLRPVPFFSRPGLHSDWAGEVGSGGRTFPTHNHTSGPRTHWCSWIRGSATRASQALWASTQWGKLYTIVNNNLLVHHTQSFYCTYLWSFQVLLGGPDFIKWLHFEVLEHSIREHCIVLPNQLDLYIFFTADI